jgi:ATP diphosphatase
MGDLLFVMVNLCRKLGLDSESTLRAANAKFTRRFQSVETRLAAEGRRPEEASLAEMESHWAAVKRSETSPYK